MLHPDPIEQVHLLHIKEGETGHSYFSVFKRCLDANIKWVELQDPYLRAKYQIHNLVRFCELLVRFCERLKEIRVVTVRGDGAESPVSGDDAHTQYSS